MDHTNIAHIILGEKGVTRLEDVLAFTTDMDRSEQTVYQNIITVPKKTEQPNAHVKTLHGPDSIKNEAFQPSVTPDDGPSLSL